MMPRWAKASFYAACGPLMTLNGLLYRRFRSPRTSPVRIHLGPGQSNYLPGWINVDANIFTGSCDVWADLRNPLPFHDDIAEIVYSHHVIEHLPDVEGHLREVFRCLRPGGIYRVGGPNGDSAIRKFIANDSAWFSDFPDSRSSIGGRFENYIFCRGEHLTILTYSFLEELMTRAGFVNISLCLPIRDTRDPVRFRECLQKEWESDFDSPHTLIVEAEKPARR